MRRPAGAAGGGTGTCSAVGADQSVELRRGQRDRALPGRRRRRSPGTARRAGPSRAWNASRSSRPIRSTRRACPWPGGRTDGRAVDQLGHRVDRAHRRVVFVLPERRERLGARACSISSSGKRRTPRDVEQDGEHLVEVFGQAGAGHREAMAGGGDPQRDAALVELLGDDARRAGAGVPRSSTRPARWPSPGRSAGSNTLPASNGASIVTAGVIGVSCTITTAPLSSDGADGREAARQRRSSSRSLAEAGTSRPCGSGGPAAGGRRR